jgi:hypothetical protein
MVLLDTCRHYIQGSTRRSAVLQNIYGLSSITCVLRDFGRNDVSGPRGLQMR